MKKSLSPYTKKERRIIRWGYFWRWGTIIILIAALFLSNQICNHLNLSEELSKLICWLSVGICCFGCGIYSIIGALTNAKHLLVGLQLIYSQEPNPRIAWTVKDRREMIMGGIFFIILAVISLLICFL